MVASLVLLLVYQLLGEVTVRFFNLDLPGPVLGMALLLVTLMARRRISLPFANTTRGLLDNLGLLYVPAGAGLISQIDRISGHWLALIATVLISKRRYFTSRSPARSRLAFNSSACGPQDVCKALYPV